MQITIESFDNGCSMSYIPATTVTGGSPTPFMPATQVRVIGTDAEIVAKVKSVLAESRTPATTSTKG